MSNEIGEHRPVVSTGDGRIVGCQCMDRVFYKGHEDWMSHLAEVCSHQFTHTVRDSKDPKRNGTWCEVCGERLDSDDH